jgi:Leucine-rich repeat (LRR) protein
LTLLDVSWSEDLTKKGLREMRQLAGLKSLNLKGCERIRDASSISNPALTSLHMGALKRLSSTAFVRNLPSLTSLDFTYCDNVACVAGISSLASLELLRLKGTAVRKVAPPVSLTSLDLSYCNKLVSLGGLGRLSALTSLDLDNSRIEDAMLLEICDQLGTHGALQNLILAPHSMTFITDAALQGIGRIGSLTSLVLERNYRITDAGMEHVGRLSRLTSLDLWQCSRITDAGLAQLGALESLTSLNIRLTAVTSLQCLSHLTALTVISNLKM